MDKNKKDLIERIERAIEKEILKSGKMGTETVSVSLTLTEEELCTFYKLDCFDSEKYSWEVERDTEREGITLIILYTEEVVT
jgi:hypothetical protein